MHRRPGGDDRPRRQLVDTKARADRAFLGLTRGSALVVVVVFALVGIFLAIRAEPALRVAKLSFLTTQAWEPDIHHFGIAGIMMDTILIAVVAVVIAVPVALGLSLFITEVAPASIKRTLVSLVDLMAAVPSIVYGLWAFEFLAGPRGGRVALAGDLGRLDPALPGQRCRPVEPGPVRDARTAPRPSSWASRCRSWSSRSSARSCGSRSRRRRWASARAPTPSGAPGGG